MVRMTVNKAQQIHIFDDPESRVHFLETTLSDSDWRATIVIPRAQVDDPAAYATTMENELKARGYLTEQSVDASGTVSLAIHHTGSQLHPVDAVRDLGLVKGTGYAIGHPGGSVAKLVNSAMDLAAYLVKEPARLFSGIYVLGDISYTFAGMSEKKHSPAITEKKAPLWDRVKSGTKEFSKPENFLQSMSGWLALAQSIIVISYANSGGELNLHELKEQYGNGTRAGVDATNVAGWTAPGMQKNLLGPFADIAKRHPIDAGAWAQIAGQVSLMAGSAFKIQSQLPLAKGFEWKQWFPALRGKAGGGKADAAQQVMGCGINIMRGLISIAGWNMLMKPAHEVTQQVGWDHPLARFRQEMDSHPERAAGLINGAASVVGLTASYIKGNKSTLWAEAIWLGGDAVMMFAQKAHYGQNSATQDLPLINAATLFMKQLPVALSPREKTSMIDGLAGYLARKTIEDRADNAQRQPQKVKEEIDLLKQSITDGLNANLQTETMPYDRLVQAAARLTECFPVTEREPMLKKLVIGLSTSPGIFASQEELFEAVTKTANMQQSFTQNAPSIHSIGQEMAQLILAAPPAANAGVAMAVRDTVRAFSRGNPQELAIAQKVIAEHASQQLGLNLSNTASASR